MSQIPRQPRIIHNKKTGVYYINFFGKKYTLRNMTKAAINEMLRQISKDMDKKRAGLKGRVSQVIRRGPFRNIVYNTYKRHVRIPTERQVSEVPKKQKQREDYKKIFEAQNAELNKNIRLELEKLRSEINNLTKKEKVETPPENRAEVISKLTEFARAIQNKEDHIAVEEHPREHYQIVELPEEEPDLVVDNPDDELVKRAENADDKIKELEDLNGRLSSASVFLINRKKGLTSRKFDDLDRAKMAEYNRIKDEIDKINNNIADLEKAKKYIAEGDIKRDDPRYLEIDDILARSGLGLGNNDEGAMYDVQIEKFFDLANMLLRTDFLGVYCKDELQELTDKFKKSPGLYNAAIVNLINRDDPPDVVGHYVLIWCNINNDVKDNDYLSVCYVDPLGDQPDRSISGMLREIVRNYPFEMKYKINKNKLQSDASMDCGQICMYILRWLDSGIRFEDATKYRKNYANISDDIKEYAFKNI